MEQLPIIYVRGYAGTQGDVEETVDDPFYGFNNGSTHVRVGPQGNAYFYTFESPLVRLMGDYGYRDVFECYIQKVIHRDNIDPKSTIWIYRYYDVTSKTFGKAPKRLSMHEAADGLKNMIDQVLAQCECDKVHLIAHSMGGLVCRCLIQRIYGKDSINYIESLFTYGTPHGGIHFDVGSGVLEWVRDRIGWNDSHVFGKEEMYNYLLPDSKEDAGGAKIDFDSFSQNDLYGYFPPEKVFCIVGTNAKDYEVALGMSRKMTGPQGDGLVQIDSAYVRNASRAYVHRSHSGRYGMVNSEEGYQNLRRFLFGEVRVAACICDLEIPAARDPENKFYQAEVAVSIRGLPILVHERTTAHYCPIILQDGNTLLKENHHLFTFFLIPREADESNTRSARYAMRLAVYEFRRSDSWFDFGEHLEQTPIWNDFLIIDMTCNTSKPVHTYSGKFCWGSVADIPNEDLELAPDGSIIIPVPEKARQVLGPKAKIVLETSSWRIAAKGGN